MIFDWDENKERLNIKNHDSINFEEASEVFFDENAFEELDKEHSTAMETRYICIGNSSKRLLRVSFTIRFDENDNEIIRSYLKNTLRSSFAPLPLCGSNKKSRKGAKAQRKRKIN
jgi:uncharacterized DUF497 family protein